MVRGRWNEIIFRTWADRSSTWSDPMWVIRFSKIDDVMVIWVVFFFLLLFLRIFSCIPCAVFSAYTHIAFILAIRNRSCWYVSGIVWLFHKWVYYSLSYLIFFFLFLLSFAFWWWRLRTYTLDSGLMRRSIRWAQSWRSSDIIEKLCRSFWSWSWTWEYGRVWSSMRDTSGVYLHFLMELGEEGNGER